MLLIIVVEVRIITVDKAIRGLNCPRKLLKLGITLGWLLQGGLLCMRIHLEMVILEN